MYVSILRREPFVVLNLRREIPACQTLDSTKTTGHDIGDMHSRRRRALKMVDKELSKGNFKTALSLVKKLQGAPGGLRGFGAANEVLKNSVSLDELSLSTTEMLSLRSMLDLVLHSVRATLQFSPPVEMSVLELKSSVDDERYSSHFESHLQCMQHEAGHLLVGYLLGVFPKKYSVASMEAVKQERFSGGNIQFLGSRFLTNKYKHTQGLKSKTSSLALKRFLCVILGGLVAEHLVFGSSRGLHSDVRELDKVLKHYGFTEDESNAHIEWAALTTILILQRHAEARSMLAEAMALGRSVGTCIDVIENNLCNEIWAWK